MAIGGVGGGLEWLSGMKIKCALSGFGETSFPKIQLRPELGSVLLRCELLSIFLVLLEQIQQMSGLIRKRFSCDLHSDFLVLLDQIQLVIFCHFENLAESCDRKKEEKSIDF